MFVYQPPLDTLELKKDKSTDYVLSWNQREYLILNLSHDILLSWKEPLAMEQNNYFTKIVNVYIVYDLDSWERNPSNNFKFKNCLFGATSIVWK